MLPRTVPNTCRGARIQDAKEGVSGNNHGRKNLFHKFEIHICDPKNQGKEGCIGLAIGLFLASITSAILS